MHFDDFSFGTLRIDSNTYEEDVVIDHRPPCPELSAMPEAGGVSLIFPGPKIGTWGKLRSGSGAFG
jgi:hypothetical protein